MLQLEKIMIGILMQTQPDDTSCGPTCLHAVYQYYGNDTDLDHLVKTIERSLSGGTLAPLLANHALSLGFDTIIYVNNLNVFDPTWFSHGKANPILLYNKLEEQMKYKT